MVNETVHRAVLAGARPLFPEVVELALSFPSGTFRFTPGQSVDLQLGPDLRRAYTIASGPHLTGAIELCVRTGRGAGSRAVRALSVGQEIDVIGPHGDLAVPDDDLELLFLAGDTGIAPVRSMVLHLVASSDRRPRTLLFEPWNEERIYGEEFQSMADQDLLVYRSGRIETLAGGHPLRGSSIIAVGYRPFLQRVSRLLTALDLPKERVRFESFGELP